MDTFARELITPSACKTDLDYDTPLVIQALNGLVAYPVAYSASCLRDNEGSYCFANAVSNTSSTTDSYPYYLPIGQELPAGSRPTCNSVSLLSSSNVSYADKVFPVSTRCNGSICPICQQCFATYLENLWHSRTTALNILRTDFRQRHSSTAQSRSTDHERVTYTNTYSYYNVYTFLLPVMERRYMQFPCTYSTLRLFLR
jgi:hypothetical protein